jgi:hypothetical protein
VGKEVPIMSRHYAAAGAVRDRTTSRPVVVVDDLSRLRGPLVGTVALPVTLDWTPRSGYDLSRPAAVRSLYQVVLREARTEADIEKYLNADVLISVWGSLTLPAAVRQFWEETHPGLTH